MITDADVVQDFFDHGIMALTKKKHPVWVIKVSPSHLTAVAEAGIALAHCSFACYACLASHGRMVVYTW